MSLQDAQRVYREQVMPVLQAGERGEPQPRFNLAHVGAPGRQPELLRALPSVEGDERDAGLSVLEYMWLSNAHQRGPMPEDLSKVEDFAVIALPRNFHADDAVIQMSMQDTFRTCQALAWRMDGDVTCTMARTPAWYAEFNALLELVRWRAYFLAVEDLTPALHDLEEYVRPPDRPARQLPVAWDSDDEADEEELVRAFDDIVRVEANRTTEAAAGWVVDMCAMLTHIDVQMAALASINLAPPPADKRPGLKPWRTLLIEQTGYAEVADELLVERELYEYKLALNWADDRIARRKDPTRVNFPPRFVLTQKSESLVNDLSMPKSLDEYWRSKAAEGEDRDLMRARYRIASDAALAFTSSQLYDKAVQRLVLERWEHQPPLQSPVLIYVRAACCWGVVFAWPDVARCDSMLEAYVYMVEEMQRRGMKLEVDLPGTTAVGVKRIKLIELTQ